LFAKALAKKPEDRFGSATALIEAIDAVTNGRPIPVASAMPADVPVNYRTDPREPKEAAISPGRSARETPGLASDPMAETLAHPTAADMNLSIPPLPGTWQAKRREWSQFAWQLFLVGLLSSILPAVSLKAWGAVDGSYRPREPFGVGSEPRRRVAIFTRFSLDWHSVRSGSDWIFGCFRSNRTWFSPGIWLHSFQSVRLKFWGPTCWAMRRFAA
jgi:hypothetical protein